MKDPKVSVIVPVYGVEKYLPTCIESLVNQTLQDIEIILVDDCSPDNCAQIMEDYRSKYPDKIVTLRTPENVRQGGARNLGIRYARGKYIGFVDADDLAAPTLFEEMLARAEETDADMVCVRAAFVSPTASLPIKDTELKIRWNWSPDLLKLDSKPLDISEKEYLFFETPVKTVWSGLYKKEIIFDHSIWFIEHRFYEDTCWLRILLPYLSKITFVDKVLYYARENPNSTSRSRNKSHNYFDRVFILNEICDEFEKRGLYETYKNGLEFFSLSYFVSNIFLSLVVNFDDMHWDWADDMKQALTSKFPHWRDNPYICSLPQEQYDKFIRTFDNPELSIQKIREKYPLPKQQH